jgi:hypothetical protein
MKRWLRRAGVFVVLLWMLGWGGWLDPRLEGTLGPRQASTWSEGGYNDTLGGHKWIIRKAVELVRQKEDGYARRYRLDSYLPYLYYGAWFADPTVLGCSVEFLWGAAEISDNCDAIHHYGTTDTLVSGYGPFRADAAGPGDFAAPYYAQILYDQAVKFWPGRTRPELSALPYLDAGWFGPAPVSADLRRTYVGGLPFCEKHQEMVYCSEKYGDTNWASYMPDQILDILAECRAAGVSRCPKWPYWAASDEEWKHAQEDPKSAMIYLGWSLHLIQDLVIWYHACNEATVGHSEYESATEYEICNKKDSDCTPIYEHLPVPLDGSYHACSPDSCPVYGDFYDNGWSVQQFADRARDTSCDTGVIPIAELDLDLAIKLTAGVLEKYFAEISLRDDELEPNNTQDQAYPLTPYRYQYLTLSDPADVEWYSFNVYQDYMDVGIDFVYNKGAGHLAAHVSGDLSEWQGLPVETSYGKRIEMRGLRAGKYYLKIDPLDRPLVYDIALTITAGSMPGDSYEPNDTPKTAALFFNGCDETGDLNIDSSTDDDYYYLETPAGYGITAQLEFDPQQGELELFFEGLVPTRTVTETSTVKTIRVSGCPVGGRGSILVTGAPNTYSLCMSRYPSIPCGYEPPPPDGITGFCFESELALDNVRLVSFRRVAAGADVFIPPDTDGDVGGNVPAGVSCYSLTPYQQNPYQNYYVAIGTTEDEQQLVISASVIDLTGADFDSLFPEFGVYGGKAFLIANLGEGWLQQDAEAKLDDAGEPDGLLLTHFGTEARLYRFSNGIDVGRVRANWYDNPDAPAGFLKEPEVAASPGAHSFGSVAEGSASTPKEILLSNIGEANLHISNYRLADHDNFSFNPMGGSDPCGVPPRTLGPDESCTVTASFRPGMQLPLGANLTIITNDPDHPELEIFLSGEGGAPPSKVLLPLVLR